MASYLLTAQAYQSRCSCERNFEESRNIVDRSDSAIHISNEIEIIGADSKDDMTDAPDPIATFPSLDETQFHAIDMSALFEAPRLSHPPRILMLYGSLRERSYSRLATEEAARILRRLGAEVRIFDPAGLPLAGLGSRRPSQGQGTARALDVVGRPGLVLAGAPRLDDRHHQGADRLAAAVAGRRATDPGAHAGGDAGLRRLAELQRRQPAPRAWPLDAHVHHPQPVLGRQGVQRVRRRTGA